MKNIPLYIGILVTTLVVSCQKKEEKMVQTTEIKTEVIEEKKGGNKRKPIDFAPLKTYLNLEENTAKKFDEITAKYQKMREENFEAMKKSGKMDRVALGIKNEEITKQQADEMSKILSPEQMEKFNEFVEKNSRKRPRYNDDILAEIEKKAGLSPEQMKVVNAANNAFEKAFHEAHDIYHGNNELAKEYWNKLDQQRKNAIKLILNSEQYQKFEETVKEIEFEGRK